MMFLKQLKYSKQSLRSTLQIQLWTIHNKKVRLSGFIDIIFKQKSQSYEDVHNIVLWV